MTKKTKDEVTKIVTENWMLKTAQEISQMCGLTVDSVRKKAYKLNLPKKPAHFKSKIEGHEALQEETSKVGIPIEDVKHYWYKGEHFSIFAKNKEIGFEEIKNEIIESVMAHAPKYPKIAYPKYKDAHLFVISPADVHINKLCSAFETGDEYTIQIAVERVKEGVISLLSKVQPYNIDKVLFIMGNDILHTDNAKSTTTSGTFQDTQVMWYDAFMIAKRLIIDVIRCFYKLHQFIFNTTHLIMII